MRKKIPDIQSDSGGVVVEIQSSSTFFGSSVGYVENTNKFPVRVKEVKVYSHEGECTEWLKVFQPGERVDLYINSEPDRFYVYDMNGVEIGFIIPRK